MDTHTCICTHTYMKGTYMHINAYSTHTHAETCMCTDLFLVSNQAMRTLEMLKYHTHQTPWEQQVGAATCNSDSIFFLHSQPSITSSSLTTQAVLLLSSLRPGPWNSSVFPRASAFRSVQDSYTVRHNASAQLTTSGWLLGHPRREVLIAPSLICR